MAELLETERSYVKDLELAIRCFLRPMVSEQQQPNSPVPAALRGKEATIFGNVEEILAFHQQTFLKELEKYETMPEDVGHCFVTWVRVHFHRETLSFSLLIFLTVLSFLSSFFSVTLSGIVDRNYR